MKISQIFISFLPFLLFLSTTTTTTVVDSRPAPRPTLPRRGALETCIPLFGNCNHQWTYNPFTSTPFLQNQNPPQTVVVPSPPPPPPPQPTVFDPYFTPPSMDANPTFSPLIASPPPPQIDNVPRPFFGFSNSPPVEYGSRTPETVLPPIAERNQPGGVFTSPPADMFNVPPPPVVDVDSEPGGDAGELPQLPPVAQSPPAN